MRQWGCSGLGWASLWLLSCLDPFVVVLIVLLSCLVLFGLVHAFYFNGSLFFVLLLLALLLSIASHAVFTLTMLLHSGTLVMRICLMQSLNFFLFFYCLWKVFLSLLLFFFLPIISLLLFTYWASFYFLLAKD